jgi:hypothetical protein
MNIFGDSGGGIGQGKELIEQGMDFVAEGAGISGVTQRA